LKYYFDTSSLVKIYHPEDGRKEALDCYLSDAPQDKAKCGTFLTFSLMDL